ncbi:Ankyrin-2 [Colletotrichum fructicola]|uniref:Ankyrin unc44 n=1 Tax=Colletotrichum fructicola (strain Nara gc5) TaxID=1213859 RepID=L2FTD9_COLFN|nr:uncharacterized protein CGMCC3_g5620 [Colletotrichum fructicola]KAF4480342.1 Ankyrin-2 [Colletotrichum fructicola Nara gc5]KAE9578386.1 hypothetical protein CGMCC3_g5620 [Colletotrichum fructicola]KAF4426237.1 Ankyrin-2 [Colletotrichum fructicola]KAF4885813.1 Ankyrin-2 [Colletotrichum fructicola]KAF4893320.1 Ankyrin-2 [Colletotrichum fructicola]
MEPFNIVLLEEGDSSSALRTRNANGEQARNLLIDRGNSLILQASLATVNHGDFTPDGDAAFGKEKHIETWFKLYQRHTDFSTERYPKLDSGLKIACWFGLVDLAKETIQQTKATEGCDENLTQALDLAAGNGQKDTVDILLEAGALCGDAMCWAADGGFLNIIETLYEANKDTVKMNDRFERPPFLLAALSGNEKIAAYLLEKGADYDVVVGFNLTALHLAATTGQMAIVRPLIKLGVDVKAVSGIGDNALHMAAAGGFDEIVTLLLEKEVDKNGQNNAGKTALHLAV